MSYDNMSFVDKVYFYLKFPIAWIKFELYQNGILK